MIDEAGVGFFGPAELKAAFQAGGLSRDLTQNDINAVFEGCATSDECTFEEFEVSLAAVTAEDAGRGCCCRLRCCRYTSS